VRLRAAADVLLEEHTPRGKGNYAALLSAPIPPIADPICRFLEREGYVGFANFDLRTDRNSGVTYALDGSIKRIAGDATFIVTPNSVALADAEEAEAALHRTPEAAPSAPAATATPPADPVSALFSGNTEEDE
jgi:hypothetical protein